MQNSTSNSRLHQRLIQSNSSSNFTQYSNNNETETNEILKNQMGAEVF